MEKWSRDMVGRIQASSDLTTIKTLLIEIKNKLDFEHVLFAVQLPETLTNINNFIISDFPEEWMERYGKQGYVKNDPVVKEPLIKSG